MKVYHGSKSNFDQFNHDYIGANGTSEGIGFYFTDSKRIAEGYAEKGYLYTVEFNGKKSLSSTSKTITKSQLKKFLKILNTKRDYLSNYGDIEYEGLQKVLNEAVENEYNINDNDVDLICGICHGLGNSETCLTTLYNVLGYDSIVLDAIWGLTKDGMTQRLYIALVNEAFNIVEVKKFN